MKSKIENCLYMQVAHCNKCGGQSGYNIIDGEKVCFDCGEPYEADFSVSKVETTITTTNSQDQGENEPEKVYVDPIVPDFIAEKLAEERYNTREILLNGTKPLEVEDTSEEWVKEFKFSYGHLYIQNEDGEFCKINGEVEDMIDFIRQLLEERVENVLEQIQDWLSSDKGGDMDDEYLNILIDDIEELKLNTKKEMKDFNPIEQERKFLIYFITILLLPILATYLMLILAVIL